MKSGNCLRPSAWILSVLVLCAASVESRAATIIIHAQEITDTANWQYPDRALGAPQSDCQNIYNFAYNDEMSSTQYIEVTRWGNFSVPAGEVIRQVFIDVNGRYDTSTSNNRFGLRARGTVPVATQISPAWSQGANNDACAWRMGGNGWEITGLLGRCWTEADVDGLQVAVRRYPNNDSVGDSRARVNALRVVILTGPTEVFPEELEFWEVAVGDYEEDEIEIYNDGTGILTVDVGMIGGAPFSLVAGGGSHAIPVGEAHYVTVGYAPTTPGDASCTITTGCGGVSIPVTGSAYCEAICDVSTDWLDFDAVPVGEHADDSFVIYNEGACHLQGVVALEAPCTGFVIIGGGGYYDLAPGQSRTVTIRFTPVAEADYECEVTTGCDDATVILSGYGECEQTCSVAPDELDFGDVEVGSTITRNFMIHNPGPCTVAGQVAFADPCPGFAIVAGGGPYTLGAGQSRQVTVAFTPTADDFYYGDVETGCDETVVALEGAGVVLESDCYVSEGYLDFDEVEIGEVATASFFIYSIGDAYLHGAVTMDCPTPPFSLLQGAGEYHLAPGDSLRVVIEFAPVDGQEFECAIATGCLQDTVDVYGAGGPLTAVEPLGDDRAVIHPNPSTGSVTIAFRAGVGARDARVEIFDIRGRLQRTIRGVPGGDGRASLLWDGRSDDGSQLPAGVYLVRRSNALGDPQRIVLLR